MKPRLALAAAALCASVSLLPHAAGAAPGLLLGVDDDSLKWYGHTSSLLSIYRTLDLGAVRVTLNWTPGESFPSGTDRTELQRAANAGRSIRVVLAVTGPATQPPLDDASRAGVLRLRRERPAPLPVDPRRRDLDGAELGDVLAAAQGRGRRLRGAARDLLGRAARGAARRERDRDERAAREPGPLVRGSRPAPTRRAAARCRLRHGRPQRVSRDLGRGAGRPPRQALALDRRGRPQPPARRAPQGVRRHRPAAARARSGVTVWYLEDGFQTIPDGRALHRHRDRQAPGLRGRAGGAAHGRRASSRTASRPSAASSTSSCATTCRSTAGSRGSCARTGARSPRSPRTSRRWRLRPPHHHLRHLTSASPARSLTTGEIPVNRPREASNE